MEDELIRQNSAAISRPKLSFLANRGLHSARAVRGSPTRRPHARSSTGAPVDDGGKQTQAAHKGSNAFKA
jgi:hypothetical protein